MDAFIYNADIYCRHCGEGIRHDIEASGKAPADTSDEWNYDSADYPKGPYREGGGEADTPQHCGNCGVFLENPLTPEGLEYVRNAAESAAAGFRGLHGLREGNYSWDEVADYARDSLKLPGLGEWIRFYLAWG